MSHHTAPHRSTLSFHSILSFHTWDWSTMPSPLLSPQEATVGMPRAGMCSHEGMRVCMWAAGRPRTWGVKGAGVSAYF